MSFWPEGRGAEAPESGRCAAARQEAPVPRAAAACRQLAAMTTPFAPRSRNLICTDQYGGPQQAVIAGTHRGNRIWVLIGMRNGCDIARAKKLAFLVPGFPASPNS